MMGTRRRGTKLCVNPTRKLLSAPIDFPTSELARRECLVTVLGLCDIVTVLGLVDEGALRLNR